ncbi:MAG: anhydro-N-acetylmuramic acid kinase [Thermoguttaceae bacterium]|nr:anhydro-N-acetylmuramic acid kinase [Thermoguttaceae bacterium]
MFFFKNKTPVSSSSVHWFVGVHISSNARKLETALVGLEAARPGSGVLLQKSMSFDLPEEIFTAFDELRAQLDSAQEEELARRLSADAASSDSSDSLSAEAPSELTQLFQIRVMLTSLQVEALEALLAETDVRREEIVAVAINDPGVWTRAADWDAPPTRYGLADGAALAEKTGLNVVDAFVGKDWATEGRGLPVFALPYWILLGGSERDRLLLDLGETARWTYIPSSTTDKKSWARVAFQEVVPCGSLLNALTEATTKGESKLDLGGRLSVQGSRNAELLDLWREVRQAPGKDALPPRYFSSPLSSAPNASFYLEALRKDESRRFNALDALCTAVHYIAEAVAENVEANAARFNEPFDVVLTGAAKQNCLLFNRLSALFTPRQFHSLDEYGFLEDSFDAVAVATLGALFAAGVPASLPQLTGAARESLLGRVSPGTPENWKRFWQFRLV